MLKLTSRTTMKVIGALLACGIAVAFWPVKKVAVEHITLQTGDVEEVFTPLYNAAVQADKFARVKGSIGGEVKKIPVERGDRVKGGDLIIKLKDDEASARLQLAEANLVAGLATLNQARIKRDASQKNLERINKLRDSGLVPEANFDQAKTEADLVQKSIDITEADIDQLKASIRMARSVYDATFIRAPFDGSVADIFVQEGESVIPGAPVYEIYDDGSLYVMARFDEMDASKLSTGLDARVTYDTMQGKYLKGAVEWISDVVNVDIKSGKGVDVKITLLEREANIRIGMSVEVEVVVNVKKEVRYLPTAVIMGKGGEKFVYSIEKGRAEKRLVSIGLSNWDRTEILDGVKEGAKIISSINLADLKEHARVVVQ